LSSAASAATANTPCSDTASNRSLSGSSSPNTRAGSPSATSVDDTVNPAGPGAVHNVTADGSRPRNRRTGDRSPSGVANGSV
jgi:hypothetical protein